MSRKTPSPQAAAKAPASEIISAASELALHCFANYRSEILVAPVQGVMVLGIRTAETPGLLPRVMLLNLASMADVQRRCRSGLSRILYDTAIVDVVAELRSASQKHWTGIRSDGRARFYGSFGREMGRCSALVERRSRQGMGQRNGEVWHGRPLCSHIDRVGGA